jgi:ribosomal protein S12 methylthiotransferase accessory factor
MRRLARRSSSCRRLQREVGPWGVVDPFKLGLPAGSRVDADTELTWVAARRWPTGETVWVPLDVAASLEADVAGYAPFTTPITNGLGAGDSTDRALGHALAELIQRDGNGLSFRALDQGVELDVAGADPTALALLDRLRSAGVEAIPKLGTSGEDGFGMANVYVVGRDTDPAGDPLMATACGEAADLDRDRALRKAVLEFAAARARKAFTHGPLDRVADVAPTGYLDDYLARHGNDVDEGRALDAMVSWLSLDADEMAALLSDTVFRRASTVPFTELPTFDGTVGARTAAIVERLTAAGLDVLWIDLSPIDAEVHGVHAVKAIVPGLEVETMSYHRIGERGAARLLARQSPLVGRGRPSRPGTAPIRLTAAATERLGGPVWLDVAEIDRIVGRLYPLYREPGRHMAPLAARSVVGR